MLINHLKHWVPDVRLKQGKAVSGYWIYELKLQLSLGDIINCILLAIKLALARWYV